jgi:hypothetical protein
VWAKCRFSDKKWHISLPLFLKTLNSLCSAGKYFPYFCGNQSFIIITVIWQKFCHWLWSESIKFSPLIHTCFFKVHFSLMLAHTTKSLLVPSLLSCHLVCYAVYLPPYNPLYLITITILREEYKSVCNYLKSFFILSLLSQCLSAICSQMPSICFILIRRGLKARNCARYWSLETTF